MRIEAEETTAKELEPGDLFHFIGQPHWDSAAGGIVRGNERSVGEKCYIRTEAPCPDGHEDRRVYRLHIHTNEPEDHDAEPE